MRLLDYFLLYLYHFVYSTKEDVHALISICTCLSLFVTSFVISMLSLFGMLFEGEAKELMRDFSVLFFVIIYFIVSILIFVRYMKYKHLSEIEKSYRDLSRTQRLWVKISIYFLEITLPIFLFVCFRLFLHGQVKWW